MQLTGVDGTVWTFDTGEPVTLKDIRGLGGAPFGFDDIKSVGQAGVTFVGRNDDPNATILTCNFSVPGSEEDRLATLDDWLTSLGRGTAAASGGPLIELLCLDTQRFQMVRLVSINEQPPYQQVASIGFWRHEVTLRSDETWWRATPNTYSFAAAGFGTASVLNDGQEPVWPHLKLTGPITSPVVGWSGAGVALPNVAAGGFLDIETDPDWWTVVDQAGVDRSWIGNRWYKQLPTGTTSLTITGTGTTGATKLDVTVPQLFHRAL